MNSGWLLLFQSELCSLIEGLDRKWWNRKQYKHMREYMYGYKGGLECADDLQSKKTIVDRLKEAETSRCSSARRRRRSTQGQTLAGTSNQGFMMEQQILIEQREVDSNFFQLIFVHKFYIRMINKTDFVNDGKICEEFGGGNCENFTSCSALDVTTLIRLPIHNSQRQIIQLANETICSSIALT